MYKFLCCLCLCEADSKLKYRIYLSKETERTCYSKLGMELCECIGFQVPQHIQVVCKKCRDGIYHVRKMQINTNQRTEDLKRKVQSVAQSTGTPKTSDSLGNVHKRTLSPASISTGISPVAKRLSKTPTARELFPASSGAENQLPIHICRPSVLSESQQRLLLPKPPAQNPLQLSKNSTRLHVSSPSRIPVRKCVNLDEHTGTTVEVMISGGRPLRRTLSPHLSPIGVALCRGSWRNVAKALIECDEVCSIVLELILKQLSDQCEHLCEKVKFQSILRHSSLQNLLDFSWQSLIDEWRKEAPLLLSFLLTVVGPPRHRNKLKAKRVEDRYPAVCTGGAVLLKERNKDLAALHQLIGIYLFHGDLHKAEHKRLSKLGLTVSPNTTLSKMDELGTSHDADVKRWRDDIVKAIESNNVPLALALSYQIIGDNVDIHQIASHLTMAVMGKDHHWFSLYAVKNRVHGEHLSNDQSAADVSTLPLTTWLPSVTDCIHLREEFIVLVSRVLTDKLPAFKVFAEAVEVHISHQYQDQMAEKSEIVPLGVLLKAESKTEDIIDVLSHIQQYTPIISDGRFQPILFGGDQLTRERAVHAQEGKAQSPDMLSRLQGVIPKSEDWHALVIFYQVIWNRMFSGDSFCDKGTLKQLQNLIHRQGVPKVVKKDFRVANDFMNVVLDGHIIAALLKFFGMESEESQPQKNYTRHPPLSLEIEEKKKFLKETVGKFVDEYILNFKSDGSALLPNPPTTTHTRHHAKSTQQKSATPSKTESSKATSKKEQAKVVPSKTEDGVFNYACAVMSYGLLARDFEDATKEGDGERLCRIWRFLLLHFKAGGRTKYAIEAFTLTAQTEALLTPQMAHQLKWNRTCNTHGGKGKNKQLDLHNEHVNRVFKDDINTFRANISEHSITRSGNAVGPMMKIIEHFDEILAVKQDSGKHAKPHQDEELKLIVTELKREKVFYLKPGRHHHSFINFSKDPFSDIKKEPNNSKNGYFLGERKLL